MRKSNARILATTLTTVMMLFFIACEENRETPDAYSFLSGDGFFIINEGNYLAGNGSLSFFSYDSLKVFNNLFLKLNGFPLGDIAFSAIADEENISIVVNNSGKIVIAGRDDLKLDGTIQNLISPRYIRSINQSKAYVSSLFSDSITIVDQGAKLVSGYINLGRSSEYIALSGSFAYISNWAGGNSLSIINTETDQLVKTITLSTDPGNIVIDHQGYIWVLCNGGWTNEEYPALYKLMPETGQIVEELLFNKLTDSPTELCVDSTGKLLYYLNGGIFRLSTDDLQIPTVPFIESAGKNFYGMEIDPARGNILVTDAIDYMQNGIVYLYSESGEEIISFRTGIIPGSFCFISRTDN